MWRATQPIPQACTPLSLPSAPGCSRSLGSTCLFIGRSKGFRSLRLNPRVWTNLAATCCAQAEEAPSQTEGDDHPAKAGSAKPVSVRLVSEHELVTSVRHAAAVCNVSPTVVRRWLYLGLIP